MSYDHPTSHISTTSKSSPSITRRKSIPDAGGSGSRQTPAIVENLLLDLGKDQKSKLRDTLSKQVSIHGRDRHRTHLRTNPTNQRRLTVSSVFNHYCRGYLPPGQTFDYIEKKAQVMDLKHFYDFMKDFGLYPGCFSSRQEVTLLFQKLNLMSKKKESRVELSRAQFETFIQGVLDLKAPSHQRGMTSEDALNTWRRGKLSGDFSYWNEIVKPKSFDIDKLGAIDESINDDLTDDDDGDNVEIDKDDIDEIDDDVDMDSTIVQEIDVRNEQIRELLQLISGPARLPSLAFLNESGISLPSDSTHLQRLRTERDQIQECIKWVADQVLNLNPDHDQQLDLSRSMTAQHDSTSGLIHQLEDEIVQRCDLQCRYDQIMEQMEQYQTRYHIMHMSLTNRQYLLQHRLNVECDRVYELQQLNETLESGLHQKQIELDSILSEYQAKTETLSKKLNEATSELLTMRFNLESECEHNRILQQQLDVERSERQHLTTQLCRVTEQIGHDHDDLVQRQNAINESVVHELHQAREHENDRVRHLNDSMQSLLEKFREIQTESIRHSDLYMKERQQNLIAQSQIQQLEESLENARVQTESMSSSLNEKTQQYSGLERQMNDLQQEYDQLSETNQRQALGLKSATDELLALQIQQSELQQSLVRNMEQVEQLSLEKTAAEADLTTARSQMATTLEQCQHWQDLYEEETRRFIQIQHDHQYSQQKISDLQLQLHESRQHGEIQLHTISCLESRLDQTINDIKQQVEGAISTNTELNNAIDNMNRALQNVQNEHQVAQTEIQLLAQRLSALKEAAEQREQNLEEKIAVWEVTSSYLNRVLEQTSDRHRQLQHDLRRERQQVDLWRNRANQVNIALDQIRAITQIIPKYDE